jgi:hypothetical protein
MIRLFHLPLTFKLIPVPSLEALDALTEELLSPRAWSFPRGYGGCQRYLLEIEKT